MTIQKIILSITGGGISLLWNNHKDRLSGGISLLWNNHKDRLSVGISLL
jgi:hypothetical protein